VFHPYSFYLQKHKNAKIKRESALPFSVSPYYSTSLSVPRCPQTAFYYVPFHHLGYPISPFGVYFRHICAQCTARFSVCHLRFRCKIYAFSLSIRKIDLAPFLHFCVFAFCKCETASVRQLNKFHCAHLLAFLMMFHHRRNLRSVFLKLIRESSR
jgi:hypothetical protein